ncbi:MAG: hypothetical protein ACT4PV_15875 [Planctomycetaceae bacterium]
MLKTFLATLALAGGVGLFSPSTAEAGDWSIDIRFGSHHRGYYDRYDCYQPRTYYRVREYDCAPRYYHSHGHSHSYGYRYDSYRPSYRSYYAPRYYSRGYCR